MPNYIIALSGRKGAGKNTVAQHLRKYFCLKHYPIRKHDIEQLTYECSFADTLKEFCIETLGLTREQCYGTDEEKNTPTKYNWEDAPDFFRWKFGGDPIAKHLVATGEFSPTELMDFFYETTSDSGRRNCLEINGKLHWLDPTMLKSGKMTGRDIMQLFGTDLIRQTFGNVWAEATVRRIRSKNKPLSVITDNRFPNEANTIIEQDNSLIIRLTRSPFGTVDVHPSESALDDYDWNRPKCVVLDNANMTIDQQNAEIEKILDEFTV